MSGRRQPDLFTFAYGQYLIVQRVEVDAVLVRRVIHGARDVAALLAGMDESEDGV